MIKEHDVIKISDTLSVVIDKGTQPVTGQTVLVDYEYNNRFIATVKYVTPFGMLVNVGYELMGSRVAIVLGSIGESIENVPLIQLTTNPLLDKIKSFSKREDAGRAGCTWRYTDHDSRSVAFGYNTALSYLRDIISKNEKLPIAVDLEYEMIGNTDLHLNFNTPPALMLIVSNPETNTITPVNVYY